MNNNKLKDAQIDFPKYWDEDGVINALQHLHDDDLADYLGCGNKAAVARKLNPCFPNKPARVSFRAYIMEVLAAPDKPRWTPKTKQDDEYDGNN